MRFLPFSIILLLHLFCSPLLNAQGITRDANFGEAGVLRKDVDNSLQSFWRPLIQADGKIVVAHSTVGTNDSNSHLSLSRYRKDGSLDPDFGEQGQVRTVLSPEASYPRTLNLQEDGRILVTGIVTESDGSIRLALLRYQSDGQLDTTFREDGIHILPFTSVVADEANDVAVQPDGKILVGGIYGNRMTVMRFLRDGQWDPDFADDGILQLDENWFQLSALALRPDGKLLVSGVRQGTTVKEMSITQILPNGTIDDSFGSAGLTTFRPLDDDNVGVDVVLEEDGKAVILGYGLRGSDFDYDIVLLRINADGSLDESFADDGWHILDLEEQSSDFPYRLMRQEDGKWIALGEVLFDTSMAEFSMVLLRFDEDGNLDEGFGDGGRLLEKFSETTRFTGAALRDGKLITVGYIGGPLLAETTFMIRYSIESGGPSSTTELGLLDFEVFPNPARDQLQLNFPPSARGYQLRISDAQGRLKRELRIPPGQDKLPLAVDFASGCYFFQLSNAEGSSVQKIWIQAP